MLPWVSHGVLNQSHETPKFISWWTTNYNSSLFLVGGTREREEEKYVWTLWTASVPYAEMLEIQI